MLPHEILADLGNCRAVDPSVMYPEANDDKGIAIAKSVCSSCCVVDLCLTTALSNKELHGVWGERTEVERRTINRKIGRNRHVSST